MNIRYCMEDRNVRWKFHLLMCLFDHSLCYFTSKAAKSRSSGKVIRRPIAIFQHRWKDAYIERWKILRCDKHLLRGLMDTFSNHNITVSYLHPSPSRNCKYFKKLWIWYEEKILNEKENNWYKKLINSLHVVIINCKWISILSFTLSRFSWLHFLLKHNLKST